MDDRKCTNHAVHVRLWRNILILGSEKLFKVRYKEKEVISEKYSSHRDWIFGVEYELPYEVRFALNRLPDSTTLLEVTYGGDTVIRLFSDMGRETRTAEIITEPLKIG